MDGWFGIRQAWATAAWDWPSARETRARHVRYSGPTKQNDQLRI